MLEINANQCFYGALVRGPKEVISKFLEAQLKKAQVMEQKNIGNDEVLLKLNCLGYQIECQIEDYKELAMAIFTTLGSYAALFFKKAGEIELQELEIGEIEGDYDLQIFSECPDKTIHEKYILDCCGEAIEFKYVPSAYIHSMSSDEVINKNADTEPEVLCDYLEEYDAELDEAGYIIIE